MSNALKNTADAGNQRMIAISSLSRLYTVSRSFDLQIKFIVHFSSNLNGVFDQLLVLLGHKDRSDEEASDR